MMLRTLAQAFAIAALFPFLLAAMPATAATKAQKMETCKFGADHNKLTGKKRSDFMKRCLADANYEPEARKNAAKGSNDDKNAEKK